MIKTVGIVSLSSGVLVDIIGSADLPVVCNLSVGHAFPRCIVPFGVEAEVDAAEQVIRFA